MSTSTTKKLAGKVAVVTGASKGIGASIAEYLAAEGASVVVNYSSSKEGADKVVARIQEAGGKAVAVQGSVTKQADIDRIFQETHAAFGKADILVNNAGIYQFAPIEEVTEELFQQQFGTNVLGLLLTTKAAVAQFDPEKGGAIINISSVVSTWGPPNATIYAGTKGAVDTITRSLAKELGARKIRVNSINPGLIETEGTHSAGIVNSDFETMAISQTPLGRIGKPEDIGKVAVFLASDDSGWVTGQTLHTSGGF